MSEAPVLLDVADGIARVTLNRPQAGNTIDLPMAQELLRIATRCDTDSSIRCVVLTGNGKLFCGGGDVGSFAEAGDQVGAFLSELAGTLHVAVSRFMRMPKPLLCLVNGPAAGAGLSLAISGDVVIAAKSAHFTAAYGTVGLTPDGGMSWMLPRFVGLRRAQEIIITNRRIGAQEAAQIGLVTRWVENEEFAAEGAKVARQLADSSMPAVAGARALLLESGSSPLEAQLERETRSIAFAGSTAECKEGVAAFQQRRQPNFPGVS